MTLIDDIRRGVSRPLTEAEQDAVTGGMGAVTKLAVGRNLPGHRTGLFRMTPEVFRHTPSAGTAPAKAGGCGPFGCGT